MLGVQRRCLPRTLIVVFWRTCTSRTSIGGVQRTRPRTRCVLGAFPRCPQVPHTPRAHLMCARTTRRSFVGAKAPRMGFLAHFHLPHVNRRGAAHQTEDQVCARRGPPMPPGATHTARTSDVRTHHTPVVCWCIGASNGFSGALARSTGQSAGCSAPDRGPGVR